MALECVEVAQRGGPKDRRAEHEILVCQDGIVVVAARLEVLDEVPHRLDAEAGSEEIVERSERPAMEDAVVRQLWIGRDRAASGDLELDPRLRCPIPGRPARRNETPRGPGRTVPIADVREPHRSGGATDRARSWVAGVVSGPAVTRRV
jgi:hypothetical protein